MRCTLVAALALGLAAPLAAQPRMRGDDAARYGWLPTLEQGKAEARKTGKPLMVVIRCIP
jgi:hypothetical protein